MIQYLDLATLVNSTNTPYQENIINNSIFQNNIEKIFLQNNRINKIISDIDLNLEKLKQDIMFINTLTQHDDTRAKKQIAEALISAIETLKTMHKIQQKDLLNTAFNNISNYNSNIDTKIKLMEDLIEATSSDELNLYTLKKLFNYYQQNQNSNMPSFLLKSINNYEQTNR